MYDRSNGVNARWIKKQIHNPQHAALIKTAMLGNKALFRNLGRKSDAL
jgi:hypothetical protein